MSQSADDRRLARSAEGSVHPTADELRAFGVGRISAAKAETIEEHLESCDTCIREVEEAGDDWLTTLVRRASRCDLVVPMRLVAGYEIETEVGRGGMGVVYRARQSGLDRVVALKVVDRLGALGSPILARLSAEASALAKLDHPNIVRIHDVGEQAGRPYLAMEFVEGGTLTDLLREGPLEPKDAAELVLVLARAVQHAHDRGILHRDIKPSNVLLDRSASPSASTGELLPLSWTAAKVKLADFGLAKQLDADAGRTRTGDLLGTPQYMAPEQVEAKPEGVGPGADIYSLGAILYESLVGRPPFQAATTLETLEQIRYCEPVPPRRLQPSLSRDLDVICVKCLAKNPVHRYPSTAALADDLQRFLDHRPIHARRAPWWRRLAKSVRRRPVLSTSLLIGFAALTALIAVGFVYNARLRTALQNARQQKTRADSNFARSFDAVDRMLERVGFSDLADIPEMEPTRAALLEDAVELYEQLLRNGPGQRGTVEKRQRFASAVMRLGRIQLALGRLKAAHANLRRGLEQQRRLAEESPGNSETIRQLANAHEYLADVLAVLDKRRESVGELRKAVRLLERLVASGGKFQVDLARTLNKLGRRAETSDETLHLWERALKIRRKLARERPGDSDRQHALAETQYNLALLLFRNRDYARAEPDFKSALNILETLATRHPRVTPYHTALAECATTLGTMLMGRGRQAEGEAMIRRGLEHRKLLASRFPYTPDYQNALARSYCTLGGQLIAAGRHSDAVAELEHGYRIHRENARITPSLSRRGAVAETAINLATAYQGLGDDDRAKQRFDEAITELRAIVEADSTVTRFHISLGVCCLNYSNLLRPDNPAAALALNNESVVEFETAARAVGAERLAADLLKAHGARAETLMQLGQYDDSISDWDAVIHFANAVDRNAFRLRRAFAVVRAGHYRQALASVDDLIESESADGASLYNFACLYSLAAEAAGGDARMEAGERQRLHHEYVSKGLQLLSREDARKYLADPAALEHLGQDPDLEELRRAPAYRSFHRDLEAAAKTR